LLKACPQIVDYSDKGLVNGWADITRAATVVRMMLGISDTVYKAACEAMGSHIAASTVAYILERGGLVRSAGGYLRDLTRRAECGTLHLEPMLQSLLRVRMAGEAT
jgi:replication initiation protein RepC